MTGRDRLALSGIVALAALALVWLALVSPERNQASKLGAQVEQANAQLASAQSDVGSARAAQSQYASAYASVVSLGKAVPPSEEVPALIYQLAQASNQKHVEFSSITNGSTSGSGSSGSAAASSSTAPAAAGGGFKQMPFTFTFNGNFADLYHLFQQLDAATLRTPSGALQVSGRLLTLQGVKLEPQSGAGAGKLTGTISATAYVLGEGGGLTGGATPAAPAGGSSAATTTAASAAASSTTAAPAAVVTGGAVR